MPLSFLLSGLRLVLFFVHSCMNVFYTRKPEEGRDSLQADCLLQFTRIHVAFHPLLKTYLAPLLSVCHVCSVIDAGVCPLNRIQRLLPPPDLPVFSVLQEIDMSESARGGMFLCLLKRSVQQFLLMRVRTDQDLAAHLPKFF